MARPKGKLLWIHAASVGEANTVLPLMELLLAEHAQLTILLTTVTVTSAALMAKQLPLIDPVRTIHQFAPIDAPDAVTSFMHHWRPDVALWVDSEIWPNLIVATHKSGAAMGMINARMSARSFSRWKIVSAFMQKLLSRFSLCFAQSDADAERLEKTGNRLRH